MTEHVAHTGAWGIALFPIIVVAYYLLTRSAERKVEEEFGDAYRAYRGRMPMFISRSGQWRAMTTTLEDSPDGNISRLPKTEDEMAITTVTRARHDHEHIQN